jgi:hypothetical protein
MFGDGLECGGEAVAVVVGECLEFTVRARVQG